jgi:signal transduction histidine kinase/ActR/RegA family two-component response regulator
MRVFQLSRFIDWFVSPTIEAHDEDKIRRIRLVVVTSFMCIGIALFYSLLHVVVSGSVLAALTFSVGALLCFMFLLRVRKTGAYRFHVHFIFTLLLLIVSIMSYMEGGFEIGTFIWTTSIVIIGPHLLGVKSTIYWVLVSCTIFVLFYLFNESSLAPQPVMHLTPQALRRFDLTIMISIFLFTFVWSSVFERLLVRSQREKKLAEEEMRQAQRMESVGLLAGGIAHDFNNLLSVILTYTNMLYDGLDDTDPRREEAFQIRMAGERAADIVRQLLQFSRKEMDQPEPINLNEVLSDMKILLQRSLGESIALDLSIKDDLQSVHIDRRQIQQVLLNLTVNARDAMPNGGRLEVRTANTEVNAALSKKLGVRDGRYVKLVVSDTGLGMSKEVRTRIFEPFFTTKPIGKGTGLGLSTTYGIIRRARGAISVESSPGNGTEFSVVLPAFGSVATSSIPPKKEAVERSDKRYKVLLVEDDDGVREATRRLLSRAGFQMLSVRDSNEALRICRSHAGEIDVLLTDVVMPGMPGSKLAELVPKFQPQIAVVLMSGYADDEIVRYGLAQGRFTFVQKPFNQDELIKAIYRSVSKTKPIVMPPDNGRPATSFQC